MQKLHFLHSGTDHEDDAETVLENGEIIERYDGDFPLPSLLVNGQTPEKRPLHVVAATNHTQQIEKFAEECKNCIFALRN